MSILGDMERIFNIIFPLYSTTYPTDRRILIRTHINNIIVTFILYGTGSIELLQRIISRHKILTRTGLIT